MDQAYVPALAALSGTVVGGLTSFVTSWFTQHAQVRAQRIAAEMAKREELFGRFLDETSQLFAVAISHEAINYAFLVPIFALKARIVLFATQPVIDAAGRVLKQLIDQHLSPNVTDSQMRQMMDDASKDPLTDFAQACRTELNAISRS